MVSPKPVFLKRWRSIPIFPRNRNFKNKKQNMSTCKVIIQCTDVREIVYCLVQLITHVWSKCHTHISKQSQTVITVGQSFIVYRFLTFNIRLYSIFVVGSYVSSSNVEMYLAAQLLNNSQYEKPSRLNNFDKIRIIFSKLLSTEFFIFF